MKTVWKSGSLGAVLVGAALAIAQLGCGPTTVQKLASAVPPTAVSGQAEGTPAGAVTQAIEPTDASEPAASAPTPEPTELPPTPKPEPIDLVAQGFGQDGREVAYAFLVRNPNPGHAFEASEYQIAAYDAQDTVVATDSGYIQLILPGQELGVGGSMYLNEGVTAARTEVQLNAGDAEATDVTTTFSIDGASYRPDDMFPKASGVLTNPYDHDITDVRVSAVAYNETGEIVGGGFTFVNFVLANSSTGVDVSMTSAGQVDTVKLYATLSGLSSMTRDDELPEGVEAVALLKQGFGQDGAEVGYGMLLQNPNSDVAADSTMYRITLYAENGDVIATDEGYIDTLLPNQTLGVGGSLYVDEGSMAASGNVQIKSGRFEARDAIPGFTAENVAYLPDRYFPKATGTIASPYTTDVTNVRVAAIPYDDAGDIIGGGFTYLDFVPANGKAAAEVSITCEGTPASIELYAVVSGLTEFE